MSFPVVMSFVRATILPSRRTSMSGSVCALDSARHSAWGYTAYCHFSHSLYGLSTPMSDTLYRRTPPIHIRDIDCIDPSNIILPHSPFRTDLIETIPAISTQFVRIQCICIWVECQLFWPAHARNSARWINRLCRLPAWYRASGSRTLPLPLSLPYSLTPGCCFLQVHHKIVGASAAISGE